MHGKRRAGSLTRLSRERAGWRTRPTFSTQRRTATGHYNRSVPKKTAVFSCNECGAQSPKWIGRCPECNAWNSFARSPVAFDARLYSTPGDKSKKLISQKAVTSISNVGGGGGGVTAALQSGVLKFFDDFGYDAIGLTCKLENDVCLMGGIEPAGIGYYIVRGKGLPRIDIIGNQGRVAWPQLTAQIVSGMHSGPVVR